MGLTLRYTLVYMPPYSPLVGGYTSLSARTYRFTVGRYCRYLPVHTYGRNLCAERLPLPYSRFTVGQSSPSLGIIPVSLLVVKRASLPSPVSLLVVKREPPRLPPTGKHAEKRASQPPKTRRKGVKKSPSSLPERGEKV